MRRLAASLALLVLHGCNTPSPAPSQSPSAEQPKTVAGARPKPVPTTSALAHEPKPDAAPPPKLTAPPEAPPGMKLVPAGSFSMGADDEGEQDERPAHKVTLAGFFLDVFETTNGEYRECVDAKVCRMYRTDVAHSMKYGSEQEFRGSRQPVVGVSWDDARTYCEFRGKRLPREAEWERAARGDEGRHYAWGNEPPDPKKHGCFAGNTAGHTAEVGSFPEDAGPYGHHDLAGNVWEWMADYYDPYAYKRDTAPQGIPGSCEQILAAQDELRRNKMQGYTGSNPIPAECERVLRGGAFNYRPQGLRASNRVHHPGGWRILVAGFRCARDLVVAEKQPSDAGH